jgi:membrane-bound lytic murein transglycosylase B
MSFVGSANARPNYVENEQTKEFIEFMVSTHNYDAVDLKLLFLEAAYKQSIIDAMNRPAEKVKEWKDYRQIFITQKRVSRGVKFWREHNATLERAQEEYGVPIEIIVAILGVETYYGRITGNYRVIDALSTLAFDYPRRSAFFMRELEHFLLLSREQGLNPLDLTGSYAGAMGYGQFMPSSYRSYAVDYSGDGIADIWNDPVDAIGSVANYFARHGWERDGVITVKAKVSGKYNEDIINKRGKPKATLAELEENGFVAITGTQKSETRAIPLRLKGDRGVEFWLGMKNFYVITRYNTSFRYAMAVTQLSELLARQAHAEQVSSATR